jgi:phosphate transport system substrate-binding protein
MKKHILFVILLTVCSQTASAQTFLLRYSGAPLKKTYMLEASTAFAKQESVRFAIQGSSSSKSLLMLSQGLLDIAGVGRELREEEKAQGLVATQVGWDALIPVVNMKNPLESLSKTQLEDIFSGKLTNWEQLGWRPQAITVYTEPESSGMYWVKKHLILDGDNFTQKKQLTRSPILALAQINRDDSGIAVISKGHIAVGLKGRTKALDIDHVQPTSKTLSDGSYPLVRPLMLVSKGEPSGMVKRFIDFTLSEAGQKIMAQQCFPIK